VGRIALLALIALAGCSEKGGARRAEDRAHVEPAGPADPDATITIALETEPAALDVLAGADAVTQRVLMGDVYEGLVCPGATLGAAPVPCLADRWEEADGGTRWTFHLREARWHDGAPVLAADVAATVAAIRDTGSWLAGELEDLETVETPAPDTVVLRFGAARPGRLASLARVPIVSGRPTIGTGPLRVTGWQRGDRIELARWESYWGAKAGAAAIVYRIVERAHALRMVGSGEIDVAVQIPVDDAQRFAAEHRAAGTFGYRLPAYLAAIYNARRPALATAEQRRGVTALLDREGIAAALLHTKPITGPFPETDPGHDPAVTAVPFDKALAARLLGAPPPRLEVLVPQGSATMAKVADIWSSDARGVADLVVVTVPFADLLGRLASGDFEIALMSMTTGPELDLAPRLASTAPPDDAWCGLADAELDRLLAEVVREPDPARRAEVRRALHRRIAELQPMAFLAPDVRLGVARRDIGGIAGAPEGAPPRAARLWRARTR
jgi:peptide/nickel transport system substrate-binding protein